MTNIQPIPMDVGLQVHHAKPKSLLEALDLFPIPLVFHRDYASIGVVDCPFRLTSEQVVLLSPILQTYRLQSIQLVLGDCLEIPNNTLSELCQVAVRTSVVGLTILYGDDLNFILEALRKAFFENPAPTLSKLSLCFSQVRGLDRVNAALLSRVLEFRKSYLGTLNIKGPLSFSNFEQLNFLGHNRTLLRLELQSCGLTNMEVSPLAKGLESNHTLVRLQLENNPLGDEGVSTIATALKVNRTLEYLSLRNVFCGDVGIQDLFSALTSNPDSQVWAVDVGDNDIDQKGVKTISQSLIRGKRVPPPCKIRVLSLDGNAKVAEALDILGPALEVNTSLKRISLCRIKFSEEGCQALAKVVQANNTLYRVDIDCDEHRRAFRVRSREIQKVGNQAMAFQSMLPFLIRMIHQKGMHHALLTKYILPLIPTILEFTLNASHHLNANNEIYAPFFDEDVALLKEEAFIKRILSLMNLRFSRSELRRLHELQKPPINSQPNPLKRIHDLTVGN